MAQHALILDASVGVKWFSAKEDASLTQALAIREAHINQISLIIVPELFYYEVINALIHKKTIPDKAVQLAASRLLDLELITVPMDVNLMSAAVKLARQFGITIYDACYAALAQKHDCPLVTANPRHKRIKLGCQVIPVEEWK